MMTILLQCIAIIVLIIASGFFSGSETGFYRLSRFRLRVGVEQKRPAFRTLADLVQDGRAMVMTLLVCNNLVNYLLTSIVTLMFFSRLGDAGRAEIYATAALTPVLFVCGEMIPKILFYHWADVLIPRLTGILWVAYKACRVTGVVAALRWLSDAATRLLGLSADTAAAVDATQRHQVFQIIHETREEGLLSDIQREMIERLLQIPNVPVHTVMMPFAQVEKVSIRASRSDLLEHLAENSHLRQLVCDAAGGVCGYILIYDILGREDDFSSVEPFVRPLLTVEPTCSAIDAMNLLCRKSEKIALVKSAQAKTPLGIITLTDLVEELTGELASA